MKSIFKNIYYTFVGFLIFAAVWNITGPQKEENETPIMKFIRIFFSVLLFVVVIFCVVRWLK